jgi:DNA-binding response OmpR family regulator
MRQPTESELITAGDLEVRPRAHLALARGRPLFLSAYEWELLLALVRRTGHVVSRGELYALVWGGELRAGDRSIDVYVARLRKKLARALPEWRFIHTHFGMGYRFGPELHPSSPRDEGEPPHSPPTRGGSAPQAPMRNRGVTL